MGFHGYRRSIRASFAYVGMAAATASALVGLQGGAAFAADAITVTAGADTVITVTEGQSTGTMQVALFTDSGNGPVVIGRARPMTAATVVSECDTAAQARYTATIDWSGDGKDTGPGTVTCTSTEATWAVSGAHTYKDSGTFHISVTVVDTNDDVEGTGTNLATATVSDAELQATVNNSRDGFYTAVEGKSLTVAVGFRDFNSAFAGSRDPGITGTIDWGDGSAVQSVPPKAFDCDCNANFQITASHAYDAPIPATAVYHITVTATDDGGSTATAEFGATISDGTLTADANKSLSAVATTAFTSVVGSFKDEAGAQATVADFAASINWGDNTASSAGTLTKTADGAFSVTGTHTYAAAGSKSITATVTDEEGSTVTLHATATVGAAPIVLPATGQPHPTQPATPLILLALLILGLVSLAAGGRIVAKMPR
jgi:hypothetical protein